MAVTKEEIEKMKQEVAAGMDEPPEGKRPDWFFYIMQHIEGSKSELKGDIRELRSELKDDISGLRGELKSDIQELRSELKDAISGLRGELKDNIKGLDKKTDDTRKELSTKIDAQFKWVIGMFFTIIAGFVTLYLTK